MEGERTIPHYVLKKEDAEKREQLVFHRPFTLDRYNGGGGVCSFDAMPVETAKELLRLGYVDPEDAQNLSPTAQEMVSFCDDGTERWYLHGYVVSPTRYDTRVTFEGIGSYEALPADAMVDFLLFARGADELQAERNGPVYCWYD